MYERRQADEVELVVGGLVGEEGEAGVQVGALVLLQQPPVRLDLGLGLPQGFTVTLPQEKSVIGMNKIIKGFPDHFFQIVPQQVCQLFFAVSDAERVVHPDDEALVVQALRREAVAVGDEVVGGSGGGLGRL